MSLPLMVTDGGWVAGTERERIHKGTSTCKGTEASIVGEQGVPWEWHVGRGVVVWEEAEEAEGDTGGVGRGLRP